MMYCLNKLFVYIVISGMLIIIQTFIQKIEKFYFSLDSHANYFSTQAPQANKTFVQHF